MRTKIIFFIVFSFLSIVVIRYFFTFQKHNDSSEMEYPILTSKISSAPERQEVFFEQVHYFAEENGFLMEVISLDPKSQKKMINLYRDDIKISIFNPFEISKYDITYYNAGEGEISNSNLKDVDDKLKSKISER